MGGVDLRATPVGLRALCVRNHVRRHQQWNLINGHRGFLVAYRHMTITTHRYKVAEWIAHVVVPNVLQAS